jgi:integrase/recombinase XerC
MTPFFVLNQFLDYLSSEKRFSGHTVIAYENDLKQFFEFSEIDDLPKLAEINHQLIRSWLVNMIDTGLTNKTVNRKLSSLRSFVKWCQKNTFLDQNPFKKVVAPKVSKRLPVFVKESELDNEKLADYFSDDFKGLRNLLIIEIFYQTGIRLTELINMKISDIQNESIKVLGKRNKERVVPISNKLSQKIKDYLVLRVQLNTQEENLFIRENGKKIYEKLVYRIINIYLSSHTNLEKRSPHVLRHTFATHMMNNGVGLEVLKNLLGHADLTATQVYTHNSFSQLTNIYSQAHPRGQKK